MSKHHPNQKHWRDIMEQGRRAKPAGAPRPGAAERGTAAAPPGRPAQPLGGQRPGKPGRPGTPTRSATAGAAGAAASGPAGAPAAAPPATPRAPQLDGLGLPYITLAQLLKKLSLVGSGGEAKAMVRAGGIRVNGVDEVRPGRKLHQADKVTISGHDHHVNLG
jgi:ribosome-associated protein